jgi:hypothetical protein
MLLRKWLWMMLASRWKTRAYIQMAAFLGEPEKYKAWKEFYLRAYRGGGFDKSTKRQSSNEWRLWKALNHLVDVKRGWFDSDMDGMKKSLTKATNAITLLAGGVANILDVHLRVWETLYGLASNKSSAGDGLFSEAERRDALLVNLKEIQSSAERNKSKHYKVDLMVLSLGCVHAGVTLPEKTRVWLKMPE